MKHRKLFHFLAIALLLTLLVSTLPATPALAAENLSILPSSGKIGDEFELYGAGFVNNTDYDMYFSRERVSPNDEIDLDIDNYELLGTIRTGTDGTFEKEYFNVPSKLRDGDTVENVRGGTYYVYATLEDDETIKARAEFEVDFTPSITLNTEQGVTASQVQITGEGYGDQEDITVKYDGTSLSIPSGDSNTDSNGGFVSTILIPESTSGEHTITVTGGSSKAEATAEFTIQPEMTSTPASGAVGTSIAVRGTGFAGSAALTITFDSQSIPSQVSTNTKGSFSTSITPPLSKAAGGYIIVVDDGINTEEAGFTITTTTLTINPTSGEKDTAVTVSGSGFLPSQSITISFNAVSVASVTSDANGSFSAIFTVPIPTVGTHKIKVSDGTNENEADFSIAIIVTSDISPKTSAASPGHIGTKLTINGSGYTAGGTVTVTYDGDQVATARVATNRAFSTTFDVPTSKGGEHTIIATDGTNTGQFIFYMETTPPAAPVPLKPEMNIEAGAETYFDWEDVTDDNLPVTYVLQVANNADFSSPFVVEGTGLEKSEYTIPTEQRLKSVSKEAPYYWRVKAIDGAENDGQWSGTGAFYVGTSISLSQPWIYTIIGIGALVLAGFAFWMGRKTAYY